MGIKPNPSLPYPNNTCSRISDKFDGPMTNICSGAQKKDTDHSYRHTDCAMIVCNGYRTI